MWPFDLTKAGGSLRQSWIWKTCPSLPASWEEGRDPLACLGREGGSELLGTTWLSGWPLELSSDASVYLVLNRYALLLHKGGRRANWRL